MSEEVMLTKVDIITIGDELLIGQVVDSNSAWIARRLANCGAQVRQITSISDDIESIKTALDEVGERSSVIILTGGLGPTSDDLTRQALRDYFGGEFYTDAGILADLEKHFCGRDIPAANLQQAEIPDSCTPLRNPCGSAAGMLFAKGEQRYFALPGVPHEMAAMVDLHVCPYLQKLNRTNKLYSRSVLVTGHSEAELVAKIEHWQRRVAPFSLAYLPSPSLLRLRLTAASADAAGIDRLATAKLAELRAILGDDLIDEGDKAIELLLAEQLRSRRATVATAESCSGGYLGHLLSRLPASYDYFCGSIVCCHSAGKVKLLGVDSDVIAVNGGVSQLAAEQMAAGVRRSYGSDFAVANAGMFASETADNSRECEVWIAVAAADSVASRRLRLHRRELSLMIEQVCHQALIFLYHRLSQL